jgi:uncharacterized membrane protein (DUF106 family)
LYFRYTDYKIKETKKQLAEMQQAKKWMSDSKSGWRVKNLIGQFDEMVNYQSILIISTFILPLINTNIFY